METFRVSDSITTNPTSRQLVLYKFTRFCISCLLIVAGGGGFGFLRHFLTVEKKEAREAVDPALEQWLENFRTGNNCFEKFVFWRYLSWYFCQIVSTRTETGFYAGFEAVCIPFLTESRELDTIVTTRGPNGVSSYPYAGIVTDVLIFFAEIYRSHLTRTRGLLHVFIPPQIVTVVSHLTRTRGLLLTRIGNGKRYTSLILPVRGDCYATRRISSRCASVSSYPYAGIVTPYWWRL